MTASKKYTDKSIKSILESLILQCNQKDQKVFRRMFGNGDMTISILEIIDHMSYIQIDMAINQCKKILKSYTK